MKERHLTKKETYLTTTFWVAAQTRKGEFVGFEHISLKRVAAPKNTAWIDIALRKEIRKRKLVPLGKMVRIFGLGDLGYAMD